jgi:hypothetical protein
MKSFFYFLIILFGVIVALVGIVIGYKEVSQMHYEHLSIDMLIKLIADLFFPLALILLGVVTTITFNRKNKRQYYCPEEKKKIERPIEVTTVNASECVEIALKNIVSFYWSYSWRHILYTFIVFFVIVLLIRVIESVFKLPAFAIEKLQFLAFFLSVPIAIYAMKVVMGKEIKGYRFMLVPTLEKQIKKSFDKSFY